MLVIPYSNRIQTCILNGFGGIQDRVDPILPPDFVVNISCY